MSLVAAIGCCEVPKSTSCGLTITDCCGLALLVLRFHLLACYGVSSAHCEMFLGISLSLNMYPGPFDLSSIFSINIFFTEINRISEICVFLYILCINLLVC